jgi:hypothetical protein
VLVACRSSRWRFSTLTDKQNQLVRATVIRYSSLVTGHSSLFCRTHFALCRAPFFFLYETSPVRNSEQQNIEPQNFEGFFLRHSTFIIRYSIFSFEVSSSIKLAASAASG